MTQRRAAAVLVMVLAAFVGAVVGAAAVPVRASDPRYQRALRDFELRLRSCRSLAEVEDAWSTHVAGLVGRPSPHRPASTSAEGESP